MTGEARKKRFLYIAAALGAVYICWGATYLTIRFAVETMPPFLMAGVRFGVAGLLLYIWAVCSGAPHPAWKEWRGAILAGAFLIIGGNGGVVWASKLVPSGITALMVAAAPLWFVLINWLWYKEAKPTGSVVGGIIVGFSGIVLLVADTGSFGGGEPVNMLGAAVLLLASWFWAFGSLFSRKTVMPPSPLMANAAQMLAGGIMFIAIGFAGGEAAQVRLEVISLKSALSLGYLIIFGSIVGFSAYVWVLREAEPALVSTYAFVNPVIAVLLGWLLAGESLSGKVLLSTLLIIAAVILITRNPGRKKEPAALREETA